MTLSPLDAHTIGVVTSEPRDSRARGLIVVVEDEPAIADVVRLNLAKAGYGVHVEHHGDRALDAIRRLQPAAIILDVGLPGMDGVEICRRLRADDNWTPVLFVTARDDEVDRIVGSWERERPDRDFAPLQVLSRVARLSRHLDRARKGAFGRSDLESWEFDVLSALRRAGSPYRLSPKALLTQTLVSSGTMTNRIDRLVDRGLVERRGDPSDGRGILVEMTPIGLTRVDAAITRLVDAEADLLGALSPADRDRLAALLRKLSLDFD